MSAIQNQVVRLDRLQAGLVAVMTDALGPTSQVGWAYGQGVYDDTFPGTFVDLTLLSGPNYIRRAGAKGTAMLPPTVITYTVDFANVGQRYVVELNSYSYFYDGVVLDTVDDIRDALVALIVADTESPYTAVATVNPGEFTVTPTFFGAIWQADIPAGAITQDPTLSDDAILVTESPRLCTINVGVFSKERSPRAGAWHTASLLEAMFEAPDYMETLMTYGLGVWAKSPVTNLSAVDNGNWESRCSLDVDIAIKSVLTRPVDQIDTVNITAGGIQPSISVGLSVSRP